MEYAFIGRCNDKVWGIIALNETLSAGVYLIFWGGKRHKLQTKIHKDATWGIHDKISEKRNRGYVDIDIDVIRKEYPEFESDLNKTTMWARLSI